MGEIHSISLPRLITCPADVPCKKDCYMRRLSTRPSVKNTYDENYQTWKELPEWYWFSIIADCKARQYFRWHVCGDIPSEQYLFGMIRVAKETPNCTHLCFTKQYQIVNNVLDKMKDEGLPNNLILVFSRWGVYPCDNKYNLPEAWVALDTMPEYAIKKWQSLYAFLRGMQHAEQWLLPNEARRCRDSNFWTEEGTGCFEGTV